MFETHDTDIWLNIFSETKTSKYLKWIEDFVILKFKDEDVKKNG